MTHNSINTQGIYNIIERVNDGIVALDSQWCYTYLNSRAVDMLQCGSADKLIGKHIWTEFPDGINQPFYKAYHKALETQQPIIFEDYYPPWDQWFENRIYPSKDGLTIYFTDITLRKQAEVTIQRINRALQVLSKSSEVVMKAANSQELLNELCHIIHYEGLHPMVWLARAEHDQSKSLTVLAHQGFQG